ncbi:MAG: hypothetical protein AB7K52_03205 [Phycisphaerales bacterium]
MHVLAPIALSSILTVFVADEPPATPPPAPSGSLAGPRVTTERDQTLVRRDMSGRVVRLEIFPAEAALALLNLGDDARARARQLLVERAAILDSTVRDNIEMLTELVSAGQSGDQAEAVRIAVAFSQRLRPLARRGAVETELAGVLPPDAAKRLRELVREYEDALVEEAGKPRFEVMLGESLRLWGEQIRLSFERQVANGDIFFERMIRELKLRPDQETRVRRRIERFVEETSLNPTSEQQRAFGLELLAWLDAAQARRLLQYMQGLQPRPKPPAESPKPASEHAAPMREDQ